MEFLGWMLIVLPGVIMGFIIIRGCDEWKFLLCFIGSILFMAGIILGGVYLIG